MTKYLTLFGYDGKYLCKIACLPHIFKWYDERNWLKMTKDLFPNEPKGRTGLYKKLKNQIAWLESLENGAEFEGDLRLLMLQIIENRKYFQHERLIHLLVTLGFGLFMLFAAYLSVTGAQLLYGVLLLALGVLECAYIVHYYHLETGVQKLWEIEQRISGKLNH